ncbi:MAG: nucleotidyltransferase domain-containing protein [Bacteroidota bacterium]|jgi:predicted nucleotidyltransferase
MVTQQDAIEMSRRFLSELSAKGIDIKKAYLFGSYARNQQRDYSDIDLAIVGDNFLGVGPEDIKLFLGTLVDFKMIHAKTYATADFEEGDPFLEEIIKTGFEIKFS